MHPGVGPRVTVTQGIGSGSRSRQDQRRVLSLSHETKEYCENLCIKATIDQFILVARNYPVAIVAIICFCRSVVNWLNKVAARCYCRIGCSAAISLLKSGCPASLFLLPDSFQLRLGVRDFGVEVVQLVTRVLYTVGAIQYFSVRPTFSYIAHTAITKLYLTDCQAATAINIFGLEGMLILFTPFFGNLGSGLVVVILCCLVGRAFSTNDTAISHYFLHISPLSIINAMNGTQASVYQQLAG
jgi:hypothetical protein